MEENKRGGKRLGAGRKPIGNKKKVITLYVETNKIFPFGNEDKLKENLYGYISNFGVKEPPKAVLQDLTKPTNEIKTFEQPKTNYEVKVDPKPVQAVMGSYEVFRQEILKTTTTAEIEAVMRRIKSALLTGKEKTTLEGIAKEHSKQFYTD